jgi:hypothetical protein
MAVESHVHHGAVAVIPIIALVVAVFGTLHLWAIGSDSRVARAWLALGF